MLTRVLLLHKHQATINAASGDSRSLALAVCRDRDCAGGSIFLLEIRSWPVSTAQIETNHNGATAAAQC